MNSTFKFDKEDICVAFTDAFSDGTKEELKLSAAFFVCSDISKQRVPDEPAQFVGGRGEAQGGQWEVAFS